MDYKTKNQIVRELVSEERYKEALQICKDWNYDDPEHRSILQRGYACFLYPQFYEQLGFEPATEYQKAVQVLKEVYG